MDGSGLPWRTDGPDWEGDGAGGVAIRDAAGEYVALVMRPTDRGEPGDHTPGDADRAALIVRAVNRFEALLSACGALLAAECGARGPDDDHICFHCRENLEYGGRHSADCPYVAAEALVAAIRAGG